MSENMMQVLAMLNKLRCERDLSPTHRIEIAEIINLILTDDTSEELRKFTNWVDLDNATIIAECVHHYGGKAVVEACEKYIKEKDDVAMCDGYRCDRCGFFVPWDYEHKSIDFINDYHFCPNCGCRMEGADDE